MNIYEMIYGPGFEADIAAVKSNLVIFLTSRLREKCKTRKEMCALLGCSQAQISNLMTGKLGSLSIERLIKFTYVFDAKVTAKLQIKDDAVSSVAIFLGE